MTSNVISDREAIEKILSSPSFLKLTDSITTILERRDLAEILASYLYFRSRGRSDLEFLLFVVSEFPQTVFIALRIGIPVIIPALLTDKAFRTLLISFAENSLARKDTC